MSTNVVNVRRAQGGYVYIGRGSKWGNPFVLGKDGTRGMVIAKYRAWILQQEGLLSELHELAGKSLGCYCKPLACHGDVLVELIEKGAHQPQAKRLAPVPIKRKHYLRGASRPKR